MTTPLLVFDLETMGLAHTDPILEVGAILVNAPTLEPIGEYHALVAPPGFDDAARESSAAQQDFITHAFMTSCNERAREMHVHSGLFDDLRRRSIKQVWRVDYEITQWLTGFGYERLMLAGSGVSQFDLQVVRRQMPALASLLHYRSVDVSNVREFMNLLCDTRLPSLDKDLILIHRALDDCRGALEELRAWRDLILGEDSSFT